LGQDPLIELPPLRPLSQEPGAVVDPLPVPLPPVVVPPVAVPPLAVPQTPGETIELPKEVVVPQPAAVDDDKKVPIKLDSVLRLAQDQNGLVRLARERLFEAQVEQELAAKRWLPEISMGAGWWRHEGGIQDFDGNLIRSSYGGVNPGMELRGKIDLRDIVFARLDAARKVSQQQGELSKFTADQLLDAATTYIDLLASHAAERIAVEAEAKLQRLLEQAKSLEKVDPGVRVEVARVESELGAQRVLTRRLHEGVRGASAKLVYLLGLNPASELLILDKNLVALGLVPVQASPEALIETALRHGPGVQETEAILGLLEDMRAKGESPLHFLPAIEMHMGDWAYGAGPGSRTNWDNRWDLGLQARWNLTDLLNGRQRKRLADTRMQQAYLGYEDLRGKLTLGVKEAHEAARSNADQIGLAAAQIKHAEESYNLSDLRLRENIKGRSPSEVLLAVRALMGARLTYLHAVRDYDKAQLRLFVLTGAGASIHTSR
jgi:outer membrane protein TolC